MKTEKTPGLVGTNEAGEDQLANTAAEHYAAHEAEAQAAGMTGHQFAMKHKESDGIQGHRARLHLSLSALKKHDGMAGNDDEEKDAFNEAMERNQS